MVQIKTLYCCQVYGTEYVSLEAATACENYKMLGEPPVKVGDAVKVYERYDDPAPDEVVAIEVGPSPFASIAGPHRFGEAINWDIWMSFEKHEWHITVKERHQMSKDCDSWASCVGPRSIMVNGEWLKDQGDLRRELK